MARESSLRDLLRQANRYQGDLHLLQSRLCSEDRYPPSGLHRICWTPSYLMLHISWHQCHCDLYRLFVRGYAEASPLSILEGITAETQVTLRDRCLKHADAIAQILSEFMRQCGDVLVLELDTAVCAYHSAKLILFGACVLRKNDTDMLDKQRAISSARVSLDFIDRFFASNLCSTPMVSRKSKRCIGRLVDLRKSAMISPAV